MSSNAESIRCMLFPLSSISLLIPNSAVAEIIGYSTPMTLPDSSEWFPGVVLWRGVYVPVVRVDEMCALAPADISPRSRIAIIYNPEKDVDLPYLGIQIQDIPRAYLAEAAKLESGSDEGLSPYLLSSIDEDQFARFVPDLDKIIADLKLEFTREKISQLTS